MKNKSYIFLFFIIATLIVASFFVAQLNNSTKSQFNRVNKQEVNSVQQLQQLDQVQQAQPQPQTVDPIEGAVARITKKPFGIFVSPKNSPVSPERFSGYHTAVDLETTPDEQNKDVAVKVLCDGKLLSARIASGYGGVAVQSCNLSGQAVTVVYGHIRLSSVTFKVGDQLNAGDFLANLGKGFSAETDGERKHLHLGIHKGSAINILGYVQDKNQLSNWIDPGKYLN